MAAAGVECGVHYRPLFEMSVYRQMGFDPEDSPTAAFLGERVMSLPMYPTLKLRDVDYICERLTDILKS
jgi:dTDP-4-amino-4,6-dideoxygalactose transaminase